MLKRVKVVEFYSIGPQNVTSITLKPGRSFTFECYNQPQDGTIYYYLNDTSQPMDHVSDPNLQVKYAGNLEVTNTTSAHEGVFYCRYGDGPLHAQSCSYVLGKL